MPLVTNLIDDKSPLVQYDSTWLPGTSADDQLEDQYYHGTFTTNNVTNGQVTFTFNGTGIWWYSARRNNHSTFVVQVDQNTYGPYDGYSAEEQFMVPIFNITDLNQGTHKLTLTNTGSGTTVYLGADLIVWQSNVGSDGDQLITETIDDSDSRFQYQDSLWASPSDVNLYNNGTGHVKLYGRTNQCNLDFHREMVTLFGKTGASNGPYTVQLDGGQTNTYNATTNLPYYGITLFHADNLGSGQHELTITNAPSTSEQGLGIDYALVSNLSSTSVSSASSTGSKQLSVRSIVGIAVPAAMAALSFLLAFYFYRKWKAAEATHNQLHSIHASQRLQEAAVGFTTSLDPRGHQSSGNAYQRPPGDGSEGGSYIPRSGVSRAEPVPLLSQPLGGSGQQPPDHPRLEGGGAQGRISNSPRPTSPTTTELPNYSQAMGTGGR